MQNKNFDFPKKFVPIFKNEDRYLILYGGAGSGKSYTSAQKILSRIITEKDAKHRILCVRKVSATIKNSIFALFRDIITTNDMSGYFKINKTDMSIVFLPNGNEILTSGMDDPEKLKSIAGITSIWIEEATELNKGDFDQLDLRLRGETKYYKQVIITFNPINENHWLKKEFIDKSVSNMFVHHSTFIDNIFLDDEYKSIVMDRVAHDSNLKRIYIDGLWGIETTGLEFFNAFDYSKHVKEYPYQVAEAIHMSWDFNVIPYMTTLIAQITKNEQGWHVHFLDEICAESPYNTSGGVCKIFKSKYKKKQGLFIYGDCTGRNRNTVVNKNNYEVIEEELGEYMNNYSMRVPYKNPPIVLRRDFVNKVLYGAYDIQITISSRCVNLIQDMQMCQTDVDGKMAKKKVRDPKTKVSFEEYGHTGDAFCYLLTKAFENYFKAN